MEARTQGYGMIGWAVSSMLHGHEVRRSGWPPSQTLVFDNNDKLFFVHTAESPVLWVPAQADLLARDWTMVRPTLPGETHATS